MGNLQRLGLLLVAGLLAGSQYTIWQSRQSANEPVTMERKIALAREYLELSGIAAPLGTLPPSVAESLLNEQLSGKELSDSNENELSTYLSEEYAEILPVMMPELASLYARQFTWEELNNLVEFYRTETGMALAEQRPFLSAESERISEHYSGLHARKAVERAMRRAKAKGLVNDLVMTTLNDARQAFDACNDSLFGAAPDIDACNEAVKLSRADEPGAYVNRGMALMSLGKFAQAIDDYDRAIHINPKISIAFLQRAYSYEMLEQYDRALSDYDQAIALSPNFAVSYNNKAWMLATNPTEEIRDGQEAVLLALKAVSLDSDRSYTRSTLAAAYAEIGEFEKAVQEQEKVIDLLQKEGNQQDIPTAEYRLALYKLGRPYHES